MEQSNPTSSGQIFAIEHWYVHSQYTKVEFFISINPFFNFCSCFIKRVIPIARELVDKGIEIEEIDLPTKSTSAEDKEVSEDQKIKKEDEINEEEDSDKYELN